MKLHSFIFTGRSGCGKGTQSLLLKEYLKDKDEARRDVYYLETGERFRDFIKGSKHSNEVSRRIYENGGLQPEFLAVWNWADLLIENFTGKEHLIIDGTPRRIDEARVLDSAFSFYQLEHPCVIHLDVSREFSKKLMLERKRQDDINEDEVERRLNWFDQEVKEAINYYENNNRYRYIKINGEQSIENVHADIIKEVENLPFHSTC